jgi:protein gp37
MATVSNIEWTDVTWNPVTGCTKISQGCKHCYAERMAKRLKAMGAARYRHGFRVTLHADLISLGQIECNGGREWVLRRKHRTSHGRRCACPCRPVP